MDILKAKRMLLYMIDHQMNVKTRHRKTYTYLMSDGCKYKIGKSINPSQRLKQIKTSNPDTCLIAYGTKTHEQQLHKMFSSRNYSLEWFTLNGDEVDSVIDMIRWYTHDGCLYHEYVFLFGKYKGVGITNMINDEQLSYCHWVIGKFDCRDEVYNACLWWIDNMNNMREYYKHYLYYNHPYYDCGDDDELCRLKNEIFKGVE